MIRRIMRASGVDNLIRAVQLNFYGEKSYVDSNRKTRTYCIGYYAENFHDCIIV